MSRYKINFNREPLDPNEKRGPQFEAFLAGYKPKKGFWKSWKGIATMAGIAGLGVLSIVYMITKPGTVESHTSRFVTPALKGVDVEYTVYNIAPAKDTILTFGRGTQLMVPAHAFLDAAGNRVEAAVQLKYREFHDPVDCIVSGIPMTYDSAGTRYHFETAGMLEILAFSEGKPVYVNPEAKIKVDMLSSNPGDHFNVYYLDTLKKNWTYISRDTSYVTLKTSVAAPFTANDSIVVPEPRKVDPELYNFDIAFDRASFPELAVFEKVRFEVCEDDKGFDPKYAAREWESAEIRKGSDAKHYLVTFTAGEESHTFKARPVFEGADFAKAKKLYDTRFTVYNKELKFRKDREAEDSKKSDSLLAEQINDVINTNKGFTKRAIQELARSESDNEVMRSFTISSFGIINSDCPSSLPQGLIVNAEFMDKDSNKIDFGKVFLFEKGKKAVYTYYPNDFKKFRFNPKVKNCLVAVTLENKLAIFNNDDFDKLKTKNDTASFFMKVGGEVKKASDIKKLINI